MNRMLPIVGDSRERNIISLNNSLEEKYISFSTGGNSATLRSFIIPPIEKLHIILGYFIQDTRNNKLGLKFGTHTPESTAKTVKDGPFLKFTSPPILNTQEFAESIENKVHYYRNSGVSYTYGIILELGYWAKQAKQGVRGMNVSEFNYFDFTPESAVRFMKAAEAELGDDWWEMLSTHMLLTVPSWPVSLGEVWEKYSNHLAGRIMDSTLYRKLGILFSHDLSDSEIQANLKLPVSFLEAIYITE